MKSGIINELSGKKVLILGFGREGKSTYNFLRTNNIDCILGIADKNDITDENILKTGVLFHTGETYLNAMKDYDVIIKTPGISFKDVDLTGIEEKITSQTELFLKYAGHKTIGITGTKGKSTTSSLIYNILVQNHKVLLVGNIGVPAFEMINSYDDTEWYIYELSSHQLEFAKSSPKISALLNMFEEHLDHYNSYEAYKEAKRNIYKYQKEGDYYIYNKAMAAVINEDRELKQNLVAVNSEDFTNNTTYYSMSEIKINVDGNTSILEVPDKMELKGIHNVYNAAVAATIAKIAGASDEDILTGIATFKTLPHRLQEIGLYGGVTYIDDSISTIPEATMSAVASVDNVDTIIVGGMDRGINYDELIEFIYKGKVPNVILMYDSGKQILEKLKTNTTANVIYADDLEKAVILATQITTKGKTCILSPAAASYGVFKNFEERGDKFKEFVIKYTSENSD